MNNLELVSVDYKSLIASPGEINGLELGKESYYIILDDELNKVGSHVRERYPTPLSRPLLRGLKYNYHENKIFYADGVNCYFLSESQGTIIQVEAPFAFRACKYSVSQDKLAFFGVEGEVILCDTTTECKIVLQGERWSINDQVPPLENLNWGTAENQFAGFDNTTAIDKVKREYGLPCTDRSVDIVWRPDGKFFLVSYMTNQVRQFKIFNVSVGVYSESEVIPGLQLPIAWRLTHNMITVACCSANTWRIVVFEAKGFAKKVVDMEECVPIVQLEWNDGGDVLAVVQRGEEESYLILFTVSNYTFELKQKLIFTDDKLRYIQWLPSYNDVLSFVAITDRNTIHYRYMEKVVTSAVAVNGASTCAVIDNKHVAIVNFETIMLPPPQLQTEFPTMSFLNSINRVVFNTCRKTVLIVDSRNLCYVYNIGLKSPMLLSDRSGFMLPIKEYFPLSIHHMKFYNNIVVLYAIEDGQEKMLTYNYVTRAIISVEETKPLLIGAVDIITEWYTNQYLYYLNGELYINNKLHITIPDGIKKLDSIMFDNVEYLFILNNSGVLFCNKQTLCTEVLTFVVFSQYLLYTTLDNKLFSCRMDILAEMIWSEDDRAMAFDIRCLEQGAKLVAGIPNKLAVIVQMPRGNLEMVSTDLLAIDSVNCLLNMNMWEIAMNETKLRQLNPNVIVDTSIDRFLLQVDRFLAAVNMQGVLEFILSLVDENVIATLSCRYQFLHLQQSDHKVERVCSALTDAMERISVGKYIEAIMIARVRIFGLQNAIGFAHSIYDRTNILNNKVTEFGLRAIARYWSQDEIANACWRTYDLSFSSFVHNVYKRDPQSTIMIIESFKRSSSDYQMRYKINNHIGDYQTATIYYALHLLNGGHIESEIPVEPLIEYAKSHSQLEPLYKFLCSNNVCIDAISKEYAEYLEEINNKPKAAEVYAEAGDYEAAFGIYASIFHWKEAVEMLDRMNLEETTKHQRLLTLADHLDAVGMHESAGSIYIQIKKFEKAIESCTRGHLYHVATNLAEEHELQNMKSMIKENLFKYVSTVADLIMRTKNEVFDLTNRIVNIWNERILKMQRPSAGHPSVYVDYIEYAESLRSGLSTTRSSHASSGKRSRKEQRRYVDLKEGGPYEDIAIMRAVHTKVSELSKMRYEMRDIIATLILYEGSVEAAQLQNKFGEMLEIFKDCVGKIWINNLNAEQPHIDEQLIAARKNLEFIDEQYRHPPCIGQSEWREPSLDI